MKITCPTCQAQYNVRDHLIPRGRTVSASCKKCGGKIIIQAEVEAVEAAEFLFETEETPVSTAAAGEEGAVPGTYPRPKKVGVLLLIFYTLITLGIYYPCWFITRREALNGLQPKKRLGLGAMLTALLAYLLSLVFGVFAGAMEVITGREGAFVGVELLANLLSWTACIIFIVLSFKMKRILQDYVTGRLGQETKFSGPATFFFQIYYLQYKINRVF
jgi:predicted Zn finger-like uncharacterized protein